MGGQFQQDGRDKFGRTKRVRRLRRPSAPKSGFLGASAREAEVNTSPGFGCLTKEVQAGFEFVDTLPHIERVTVAGALEAKIERIGAEIHKVVLDFA